MSEWQPMSKYDLGDFRDEYGLWHSGPDGPVVDLKMKNGRVIRSAQWRGERNVKGGTTYAFWAGRDVSGIGLYDPISWRLAASALIHSH